MDIRDFAYLLKMKLFDKRKFLSMASAVVAPKATIMHCVPSKTGNTTINVESFVPPM